MDLHVHGKWRAGWEWLEWAGQDCGRARNTGDIFIIWQTAGILSIGLIIYTTSNMGPFCVYNLMNHGFDMLDHRVMQLSQHDEEG